MTLEEIKEFNLYEDQKIPTLQEAIDVCKGKIKIMIELKGKNTAAAVNDMIIKNGILSEVSVISFHPDVLKEIKDLNPAIKIGYLFERIPEDIPENIDYACPKAKIITENFVMEMHSLGKKIYAWTVNDKKLGEKLIDMGIDEIGTDYPDLFIER